MWGVSLGVRVGGRRVGVGKGGLGLAGSKVGAGKRGLHWQLCVRALKVGQGLVHHCYLAPWDASGPRVWLFAG